MKTMLRNLACRWADRKLLQSSDTLRRALLKSQERQDVQAQELRRAKRILETATAELEDAAATIKEQRAELGLKEDQIERQADLIEAERAAWASTNRELAGQVRDLEEMVVRACAQRDTARAETDQLRPIIELAQSWRSYYHAPDPDPEVWARLESALGRAIDALPTADAAGVAGPEAKPQCPEALLLDEVELHRCIRDGGHEGDHWNRGHQRQWPQIEVDENIEVPW